MSRGTFGAELVADLRAATHCWVAAAPCGCVVACFHDLRSSDQVTAQTESELNRLRSAGHQLRRVPIQQAAEIREGCQCPPPSLLATSRRRRSAAPVVGMTVGRGGRR